MPIANAQNLSPEQCYDLIGAARADYRQNYDAAAILGSRRQRAQLAESVNFGLNRALQSLRPTDIAVLRSFRSGTMQRQGLVESILRNRFAALVAPERSVGSLNFIDCADFPDPERHRVPRFASSSAVCGGGHGRATVRGTVISDVAQVRRARLELFQSAMEAPPPSVVFPLRLRSVEDYQRWATGYYHQNLVSSDRAPEWCREVNPEYTFNMTLHNGSPRNRSIRGEINSSCRFRQTIAAFMEHNCSQSSAESLASALHSNFAEQGAEIEQTVRGFVSDWRQWHGENHRNPFGYEYQRSLRDELLASISQRAHLVPASCRSELWNLNAFLQSHLAVDSPVSIPATLQTLRQQEELRQRALMPPPAPPLPQREPSFLVCARSYAAARQSQETVICGRLTMDRMIEARPFTLSETLGPDAQGAPTEQEFIASQVRPRGCLLPTEPSAIDASGPQE